MRDDDLLLLSLALDGSHAEPLEPLIALVLEVIAEPNRWSSASD